MREHQPSPRPREVPRLGAREGHGKAPARRRRHASVRQTPAGIVSAQLRRHFGVDAAAEILALSQAKVFLGSSTVPRNTCRELVELLGRRQLDEDGGRPATC
jgi:hypothetical protein